MGEKINVWGARVHNLKNIDVEIPRDSLTVITGLSGSGKSSLAFDTIYAEGQRRYIDTFLQFLKKYTIQKNRISQFLFRPGTDHFSRILHSHLQHLFYRLCL